MMILWPQLKPVYSIHALLGLADISAVAQILARIAPKTPPPMDLQSGVRWRIPGLNYKHTTVDSNGLEHGCRMMYAGFPSFFGLGSEDVQISTFWLLL